MAKYIIPAKRTEAKKLELNYKLDKLLSDRERHFVKLKDCSICSADIVYYTGYCRYTDDILDDINQLEKRIREIDSEIDDIYEELEELK